MQSLLLDQASKLIPDQQKLINIVSKRVRQLSQGHRPLVATTPRMVYSDIALKELIDGKLTYRDLVGRRGRVVGAPAGVFDAAARTPAAPTEASSSQVVFFGSAALASGGT